MARKDNTDVIEQDVEELPEVETETILSDQEKAGQGPADPSKANAKPKNTRWTPPEGQVTLVGFAKIANEKNLHPTTISSQMVYSYSKNASKDDPFPLHWYDPSGAEVTDLSTLPEEPLKNGYHQATVPDEAVAWWTRKNERVAQRKANAANKSSKKAAKSEGAVTELTDSDSVESGEAVEVE